MLRISGTKSKKTGTKYFVLQMNPSEEDFKPLLNAIRDLKNRTYYEKHKAWFIPATKDNLDSIQQDIIPLAISTDITGKGYKLVDWIESGIREPIKLIVEDIETSVISPSPLPMEFKDALSYRPKDYFFSNKYQAGHWDGYIRLYKNGKFPTGLLGRAVNKLKELDINYEVIDKRENSVDGKRFEFDWHGFEPRHYQRTAIDNIKKYKRGICQIATGGGKTSVIASKTTQELGQWTMFVVHTKVLLHQAKREFEKNLGIDVGIIGDGEFSIKPVTVAMIQTVRSKLKSPQVKAWANKVEVIFVDECHHIAADSYQEIMKSFKSEYKIGLSASPYRDDGLDILIEAEAGSKISEVKAIELIEQGYLADVEFNYVQINPLNCQLRKGAKNYQSAYKKFITENDVRNELIVDISDYLTYNGKTVLVLVNRIGHGKYLEKMMSKKGLHVKFLKGADTTKYREEIMGKMGEKLDILIATSIADEGMDLPVLDALILAGAGKSSTKALQRVGRTLRLSDGKDKAIIYDFFDDFKFFDKHSKERMKIYQHEFGQERIKVMSFKETLEKIKIV
ncbi:MAG: DEAD/DEAH box helicase [Halanaerobiales bacterium]